MPQASGPAGKTRKWDENGGVSMGASNRKSAKASMLQVAGCKMQDSGFRIQDSGFTIHDFGFRI